MSDEGIQKIFVNGTLWCEPHLRLIISTLMTRGNGINSISLNYMKRI